MDRHDVAETGVLDGGYGNHLYVGILEVKVGKGVVEIKITEEMRVFLVFNYRNLHWIFWRGCAVILV